MNLDDLTIGQAKELLALFNRQPHDTLVDLEFGPSTLKRIDADSHWEIGQPYMIRTVTMIDTGILVAVTPQELILEEAAWIPDTGRFADAVAKAEFGEVEPFPTGRIIIGRGALIDAVRIKLAPRGQK